MARPGGGHERPQLGHRVQAFHTHLVDHGIEATGDRTGRGDFGVGHRRLRTECRQGRVRLTPTLRARRQGIEPGHAVDDVDRHSDRRGEVDPGRELTLAAETALEPEQRDDAVDAPADLGGLVERAIGPAQVAHPERGNEGRQHTQREGDASHHRQPALDPGATNRAERGHLHRSLIGSGMDALEGRSLIWRT